MDRYLNYSHRQMVGTASFAVHQVERTINGQEKIFTWIEPVPIDGGSDYLVILPEGVEIITNPSEGEVWFTDRILQVTFGCGNFQQWTDVLLGIETDDTTIDFKP